MDGGALYVFAKSLSGGVNIDPTLFNTLLAAAQIEVELDAEWRILVKKDTSQTISSSDTFLTAKNIPSDFLKWTQKNPVKAVNSVSNPQQIQYYSEVPMELQMEMKDDQNSYYVDYANNKFYICGSPYSGYIIVQFYIYKPANVNYDPSISTNNTSWVFPSWAHPILGFLAAAMHELGVDYDDLNARMGNENYQKAMIILDKMKKWNAHLAKGAIKNMDIASMGGVSFAPGRVNFGNDDSFGR